MAREERRKIPKPDPSAVKRGAPKTRRAYYLKPEVVTYKHRSGSSANRFRAMAYSDVASFVFYLMVHRGIGPNEDSFVCLAQQLKKPCPICEDIRAQMNQGITAKQINDQGLWPKCRLIMQGVDRHEEEKGVMVADIPEYKCDDAIVSAVQDDITGEVLPVTDPEEGFDLLWDYDPQAKYSMPENIKLSRQSTPLDVSFYDQIKEPNDLILWPEYDEVKEAYFSGLPSSPLPTDEEPTTDEPGKEEEPPPPDKEEPAPASSSSVSTSEEAAKDAPAAEVSTGTDDDCFGKDFGKYPKDCLPAECVEYDACKVKFEGGGEEKEEETPRAPRRRPA
jgi:hypothetical protein